MKMFMIAAKDLKLRLKDKKALLMMIFMPILLTAILGSALKGVMGDSEMPKMILGVYAGDDGALAKTFINDVLSNELSDSLTIQQATSQNELQIWIEKEQVEVGIIIPSKWEESFTNDTSSPVLILPVAGKDLDAAFVQQITESFAQTAQTITLSTKEIMTDLAVAAAANGSLFQPEMVQKDLLENMNKVFQIQQDVVQDLPVGEKDVSSMQYYAAAMAAMFLLFNAMHGGKSFHQERNTNTLARLMMTQASSRSILLGKFLGTLFFAFFQFLIFMAATHFVLGVSWGTNLLQMIFIAFIYSFAVSGLSMVVAAFTSSEKMADTLGGIGVQIFALLGGSMLPISVFPSLMRNIAMITPNSWALTSFTNIMSGTTWVSLVAPAITLAMFGIVSIIVGTMRLRQKAV
ncbi:ABC transporter permease [Cytobacillus depressus]|uniref:ABC transporter permease n=1 Tax=Cytobacillus depressus TaxID=1602942 RepID=A0A6L3V515_9BACI|nr:ABC transporter permease [Cytobacillus depressus]KAB2334552.1 ABC transporter permease [Cytobacillus depressus]